MATSADVQPLAGPDTQFLAKAIQDGMAEVELGRTAEKKASRPEVKRFAERMVKDHTEANRTLAELAKKHEMQDQGAHGISPRRLGEEATAERDDISKMSGQQFDEAYLKEMVKDHEKAVGLFKDEARHGKDEEVKNLASAMLPTLEEHRRMARSLADR